jgi:hypothetical protein
MNYTTSSSLLLYPVSTLLAFFRPLAHNEDSQPYQKVGLDDPKGLFKATIPFCSKGRKKEQN